MFFLSRLKQLQFFSTVTGMVAVMCFSLYAVFGKVLLEVLAPHTLLAIGQVLSVFLIILFVGFWPEIQKIRKLSSQQILLLLLHAFLVGTVGPLLFLKGLETASATNAILFGSTESLFLGFLGFLILREKITHNQIFGMAFIFLGVYIIATEAFSVDFELDIGSLYILSSVFFLSLGSIFFKKYLHHISPEIVVFLRNGLGAFFMIFVAPIFFGGEHDIMPLFEGDRLKFMILYVLIVIVLAQLLWYKVLDVLPSSKLSLIVPLLPLFGVLFSYLILGEALDTHHVWGGACIILGMVASIFHFRQLPHHHLLQKIRRFHH